MLKLVVLPNGHYILYKLYNVNIPEIMAKLDKIIEQLRLYLQNNIFSQILINLEYQRWYQMYDKKQSLFIH